MDRIQDALDRMGVHATERDIARFLDHLRVEAAKRQRPHTPLRPEEVALLEREWPTARAADREPQARLTDPTVVGAVEYALLWASGLTVDAAATHLRVHPEEVERLVAARRLLAVRLGDEIRLPAYQFTAAGLVPGIETIVRELPPDLHPVSIQRWFNTANPDLVPDEDTGVSLSPREWLLAGHPADDVVFLAANL